MERHIQLFEERSFDQRLFGCIQFRVVLRRHQHHGRTEAFISSGGNTASPFRFSFTTAHRLLGWLPAPLAALFHHHSDLFSLYNLRLLPFQSMRRPALCPTFGSLKEKVANRRKNSKKCTFVNDVRPKRENKVTSSDKRFCIRKEGRSPEWRLQKRHTRLWRTQAWRDSSSRCF